MQMRRSRAGKVFAVDPENRLKIFDESWKEVGGVHPKGLQQFGGARVGFGAADGDVMLWPMGGGALCIVDMDKMEFQAVERLGGLGLEEWLAAGGVSAGSGSRVACLFEKRDGGESFVAYWQNTLRYKPVVRKATYIHPNCIAFVT